MKSLKCITHIKMVSHVTFLCICLLTIAVNMQQTASEDVVSTTMCVGRAPRRANKCYAVICYLETNWFGAKEHCNKRGMRLATVENAAQKTALVEAMFASRCKNDSMWIGGSNLNNVNNWIWNPTGKPVLYEAGWHPGKPDNPTVERCMEMITNVCGFNDKSCDVIQTFICESLSGETC